jgi:hypothetical protein
MTGRGPKEARVMDSKSTIDSINAWDILPAESGWYELRHRAPGSAVRLVGTAGRRRVDLRKRMLRPDLPQTVQVGINFTSDYKTSTTMPAAEYNARFYPDKSKADSTRLVDFLRFVRVRAKREPRSPARNSPNER